MADSRPEPVMIFFDAVFAPANRLRRMTPEKAAALCKLFSDRQLLALDGDPATTWIFSLAPTVLPPAALLCGPNEEISLRIIDDDLCEHLGESEWSDYQGEARLLAWTVAHRFLIEGLGKILREPLMLGALSETALPLSDPLTVTALAFSVTAQDGRVTTGTVSLSAASISRLASHTGWRKSAPDLSPWGRLPASLRIELRGSRFSSSEVTAAEIGDVLVLGRRAHCWGNLQAVAVAVRSGTPLKAWSASYDGNGLTITDVVTERIMPEQTAKDAPAATLEGVPVTLDFELGAISLPLAQLAALKPGYVFKLPVRLEEARVVIRANGVKVGRGELVAVGDVLGIQLLAIETD